LRRIASCGRRGVAVRDASTRPTDDRTGVDPRLLEAWLRGRSLARGLPAAVADHGGLRVDTGSPDETCRYVFAAPTDGLRRLGGAIVRPQVALKLCGTAEALAACLPARWTVTRSGWMMVRDGAKPACPRLPAGFSLDLRRDGGRIAATILGADGANAASGHAAEGGGVFVYDRIAVAPALRRIGLGTALMQALGSARTDSSALEILVATDAGRALYETLGWRVISPYATALILDER
jgi:GNAT superfamily N-acetyltransferase